MKKHLFFLLAITICLTVSCNKSNDNPSPTKASDYSNLNNWLQLPGTLDKSVDIFYIYPTAYYQAEPLYSDINDESMRAVAKNHVQTQATAFETTGNIYAPVWRQAGITSLNFSGDKLRRINDSIPCYDMLAAFDYYIKHYNNGRPYIIATHSQGSVQAANILSKYLNKPENKSVYDRMIACYAIGYAFTREF